MIKKEYRKRRDENLARWIERIVPAMQGRSLAEMHDMVREVSVASYIEGANAERESGRRTK